MAFKKGDRPSGELNGFLDTGSRMKGDLQFEDTFRVDGRLEGKIESEGHLVVGEKGHVEGEVRVAQIHVAGTISGNISGAEKVEISATGKILGEIQTKSLVVQDGAVLEGSCQMERSSPRTTASTAPALRDASGGS